MPDRVKATMNMNETDVREAIVRPFLMKLGYEYNTAANIRTEIPLRYSKSFLGRKKPSDTELVGKPDYICEVVSHGRWILEAKRVDKDLTREDSHQAHTYATHPEIGGKFYLITNGREFRLFAVGQPDDPVLVWAQDNLEESFIKIRSLIGPDAIRRSAQRDRVAPGKIIAEGFLKAELEIVAGSITCLEAQCSNSKIRAGWRQLVGQSGVVTGHSIGRCENGFLAAKLQAPGAFIIQDALTKATGADLMTFKSPDEYISISAERPSIFQGITTVTMPKGTAVPIGFLSPAPFTLPFDWDSTCFVEAVGFLRESKMVGTYSASYEFKTRNTSANLTDQQVANALHDLRLSTAGEFVLAIN